MQANIELEKAIMTHHNPYRGDKMYGEDPAVAQIEVHQRRRDVLLHHRRHRRLLHQGTGPALGRLAAEEVRLAGEAGRRLGRTIWRPRERLADATVKRC